jgi:Protein of unknown function (DUF3810)
LPVVTTSPDSSAARPRVHAAGLLAIVLALVAAVLPLPANQVERVYSHGLYRRLQPVISSISELSPIAWLDPAAAVLLASLIVVCVRRYRAFGLRVTILRMLMTGLVTAAVIYLWFLLFWGFNYRRLPLEQKLAYDPSRITREHGVQLGRVAVDRANTLAGEARIAPIDTATLLDALRSVLAHLREGPLAAAPEPKRSLLALYFRKAAIDGMTDPFFLEIVVNPDLLPSEQPFVIAHEWAHIAGFADESEANFIAWLTCLRASPAAQYSGWLAAYQHISSGLPLQDRRALAEALSQPVRADLIAERERFNRSSPAVRNAARSAYDTYLRANRIEEGIANYNAVVRLMLGTSLDADWNPLLR